MDTRAVFSDPNLAPSSAWEACKVLFGEDVKDWEPDTFYIELQRKGVNVRPGLMAKLLGAQTVVTTKVWTCDYDALFAFALACQGVPAAAESFHHPTPEQLAWAICEIRRLHLLPADLDNEGFDPDEIDPAIACVLHDEGFVVAPDELQFVQDMLDKMTWQPKLTEQTKAAWKNWAGLNAEGLHGKASALPQTEPLNVQLARLAGVRAFVLDMETLRAQQHATIVL